MIPAHENLQSAEQKYVFGQILSVIGDNLAENFTVFFSFADGKTPAATGEIENTGISRKFMFQFNNSALYAKNIDGENLHDTECVWNCGQKDMEKVLKVLSNFESQPLYLTNINLEQRSELKFRLMRSVQQQDTAVKQLEDIEKMLYELEALDMLIIDHKKSSVDFLKKKGIIKSVFVTSIAGRALFGKRKHLIFCYACVHVCDANAPRENSMENSNSRSHDKCTVCRDNCPAKLHLVLKNIPQMFARDQQDDCKEAEKLNQKRQQKQQNCCNSYKNLKIWSLS